jgi:hypothetical protein
VRRVHALVTEFHLHIIFAPWISLLRLMAAMLLLKQFCIMGASCLKGRQGACNHLSTQTS